MKVRVVQTCLRQRVRLRLPDDGVVLAMAALLAKIACLPAHLLTSEAIYDHSNTF